MKERNIVALRECAEWAGSCQSWLPGNGEYTPHICRDEDGNLFVSRQHEIRKMVSRSEDYVPFQIVLDCGNRAAHEQLSALADCPDDDLVRWAETNLTSLREPFKPEKGFWDHR